jgi:hypothetical protein
MEKIGIDLGKRNSNREKIVNRPGEEREGTVDRDRNWVLK